MSDFTPQQVIDYLLGENGTFSERKSARMAAKLIEQQQTEIDALKAHVERIRAFATQCTGHEPSLSVLLKTIDDTPPQSLAKHDAEANALKSEVSELKSELNSVNEYKDKLTPAVRVLVDQLKSGKVSGCAIYDVDILLGE